MQFRILNRILGTNHLVARFANILEEIEDRCTFCELDGVDANEETICHLFYQCDQVNQIWIDLAQWEPLNILGFIPSIENVLIYSVKPGTRHQTILNATIMWVKHYIWRCKKGGIFPTLEGAKRVIMYESVVQHCLLERKNKYSDFDIFEHPNRYARGENGYFKVALIAGLQAGVVQGGGAIQQ